MEKNIDINLNLNAEVGDVMVDNRDKTYFKVVAINQENKIILGYRYAPECHVYITHKLVFLLYSISYEFYCILYILFQSFNSIQR